MASQSASPAAPQSEFNNSAAANATARISPYVDRALTKRNITQDTVPTPLPARSGSTTLGSATIYDTVGTNHEPGDQGAVAPPHSPNSWKVGRDPYKNNGMVGQTFFQNQGS